MAPGVQCRSGSGPWPRVRQGPVRVPVTRQGSCSMVSEAADGGRFDGVVGGAGDAGEDEDGCERAAATGDDRAGFGEPRWLLPVHPAREKTVAAASVPATRRAGAFGD